MTETIFRITAEQLHNLGSQLAAKANGQVLIAACGSGRAQFDDALTRESWTFSEILAWTNNSEIVSFEFKADRKFCVVSNDMELISTVACEIPNCLWVYTEENRVQAYRYDGMLKPVDISLVVGHDLYDTFADKTTNIVEGERHERTCQAFGRGTTEYLSKLTVGVAGASGTGSIVAEQLYRLGVKRLVLVDDDCIEERNLGRILNSSVYDAKNQERKVDMLKAAFDSYGLGTEVYTAPTVIAVPETVRMLSQCDLIFGCLDSADGRMHLNRISTFYTIPYIDMGVKLKSDNGIISEISCSVRYIKPGGASLFSLGVYSSEQLSSEALRRDDPSAYRARLEEKYIQGAHESSPAVISVNMTAASMAVMEFLNRIHHYRDTPNSEVEVLSQNLLEPAILAPEPPAAADASLLKYLGKGDRTPMLDMPRIGS